MGEWKALACDELKILLPTNQYARITALCSSIFIFILLNLFVINEILEPVISDLQAFIQYNK